MRRFATLRHDEKGLHMLDMLVPERNWQTKAPGRSNGCDPAPLFDSLAYCTTTVRFSVVVLPLDVTLTGTV
jgi:hypothetical protein